MTASLVRRITEHNLLTPHVNWGRWIVDCPHCSSALMIDPDWGWQEPSKKVHSRDEFLCWDCGLLAEVGWPPDELVYSAERLLMMRPDPKTRNFDPQTETLNDLSWENGLHGIYDHMDELDLHGVSDGNMLIVEDGRIRIDRLPLTGYWRQHEALER